MSRLAPPVEEDTIIGIIEVMKLMNTVRAGVRGTVAEFLAHGRRAGRIRTGAAGTCAGFSVKIRRVLIANRGEIAVRIIRTCRRLGIETVLTVSEADRDRLAARLADRTVCIGPARPADSYLKVETIVQAALGVGAQAIHPGYGFLSERAALAQLCEDTGHRLHRPDRRAAGGGGGQACRARSGPGGGHSGRTRRSGDLGCRGAAAGNTPRGAAFDQGGRWRWRTGPEARARSG